MHHWKASLQMAAIAIAIIFFVSSINYSLNSEENAAAHLLQQDYGSILVNVTDEAGRPLENVNVTIVGNTSYWLTRPNGTCFIDNLTADTYTIIAKKLGYKEGVGIAIVQVNMTNNTQLVLTAGMVYGAIRAAETLQPISNATIEISGNSLSGEIHLPAVLSSTDGSYIVKGVPIGEYDIEVNAFGYERSNKSIWIITVDDINWSDFELKYTYGIISGFILGETLLPIPEAEVFVYVNSVRHSVLTDIGGAYEIPNIPAGNYTVGASQEGYYEGFFSNVIVINGERTQNVNITLVSMPGRLFGTVTSGAILVYGATVEIIGTGLSASTGSQGSYSIEDVPTGTYTVITTAPGYEINSTYGVIIERGESHELNIVLIAKPGQLMGIIRSADTFAVVSGCNVTITGASESRHTLTNEQGQYVFAGLPPGNYTIVVRSSDFAPYIASGIVITAENVTQRDVYLELVKEALGGFISGMDLAHSLMALAFLITIVILGMAVYLRLKGLQYPEKPPAVFEEEEGEAEEEEEAEDE